jgi:exopolysaccharide production protein ExoQ
MDIPNLRISKTTESWIFIWLLVLPQISFMPQLFKSLFNLTALGFILFVSITRSRRFAYVALKDIFLLFLVLLTLVSYLWSESPSATLAQLRFLVQSTLFGVYLAAEYTPMELIRLLTRVCIIVMIISVCGVLLVPSYAIRVGDNLDSVPSWVGMLGHKQDFGPFMAFAAAIFLINYFAQGNNKLVSLAALVFAFVLLFLSNSKTGLLMFFLSLYFMPLYKIFRQGKHRGYWLYITLTIYISIGVLLALNLETIVVDGLGKNLEFNGRLPVWQLAIKSGLERPWLGYGYNGFWTSKVSDHIIANTWAMASEGFRNRDVTFHSHNGYIDLFLQLGVVGLILFAMSLFCFFKRIIYLLFLTRKIEYFCFFILIIIHLLNISEGSRILTNRLIWTLHIGITWSCSMEYYRTMRSQNENKFITLS